MGRTSARVVAGLVALAALLGLGAGVWLWTRPDPVLERATRLAAEGLEAARSGSPPVARARRRSAIGLLYRHGHLDHVTRADFPRVALQTLGARLGDGVDLWTVCNAVRVSRLERGDRIRLADVDLVYDR